MTDTAAEPGTWVPRIGDPEVPAGHAELIRGLYRLAAWVADHPEIPTPYVTARVYPGSDGWAAECRVVDDVADALGVGAQVRAGGTQYVAESRFGPVGVEAVTITAERMARFHAEHSYVGAVEPDADADRLAGGDV